MCSKLANIFAEAFNGHIFRYIAEKLSAVDSAEDTVAFSAIPDEDYGENDGEYFCYYRQNAGEC